MKLNSTSKSGQEAEFYEKVTSYISLGLPMRYMTPLFHKTQLLIVRFLSQTDFDVGFNFKKLHSYFLYLRIHRDKTCFGDCHLCPTRPVLNEQDIEVSLPLRALNYSWNGLVVDTHAQSSFQKTERATTNPRSCTENSWQGESRSALNIFV